MRRCLALSALLGLAGAAPVAADSLGFQYTVEREHEGSVIEGTFLRGFETRDGLRVKIKLNQESYCYVIMSSPADGYRLVFPDAGTLKAGLPLSEWARTPKSTFLRMGEDPRVQRMYIIVAAQRVPELDDAAASGHAVLSETKAFEVRDRYHGEGSYSRALDGPTVSVTFRPKASDTRAVVEEITVQPFDPLQRSVSK